MPADLAMTVTDDAAKPLRADARRNRDALLVAARETFAEQGVDGSLEEVARRAGVGVGTLYRHFPTREALVDAAYRNELERLCEAASELLAELPADRALRAWMDLFVAYMTTKRGMADALRAVIASGGNPFAESRARLGAAVGELLGAGAAGGVLRRDAEAVDVLTMLSGVSLAAGEASAREQAGRLLDLLMDGLRPRPL